MAAPNLGAGDDGKDAAPTQFSTQSVASHLGRRGRTTCGANHAVRGTERDEDGGCKGRDSGRARLRRGPASRDATCSRRASRPPRMTRTAGQHRMHLTRSRSGYGGGR
eukprot:scaffold93350_cov54-Phaeocystis_antarctica.AAC.2